VTEHHLASGVVAEASGEDVEDERVALRIGEVAKLTGLTTRTLRYWEEVGLITPSGYRDSGERMYSAGDVGRATRIRELQDLLGFSLAEVRIVLDTEDVFDSLRSVIAGNPCDSRLLQMIDDAIVANDRLVSRLDDTLVRIHAFRDERRRPRRAPAAARRSARDARLGPCRVDRLRRGLETGRLELTRRLVERDDHRRCDCPVLGSDHRDRRPDGDELHET
jgi:DNA-binding transcriptional MerR regulator